jgi:hypothetical protein
MKKLTVYTLGNDDETSRFGKRLAEAVACCGGCLASYTGFEAKVLPNGWHEVVKAHSRIFLSGQFFTDKDVSTLRDGCLALADRCAQLMQDGYWPEELKEAKELAVKRLREAVLEFMSTFNHEKPV